MVTPRYAQTIESLTQFQLCDSTALQEEVMVTTVVVDKRPRPEDGAERRQHTTPRSLAAPSPNNPGRMLHRAPSSATASATIRSACAHTSGQSSAALRPATCGMTGWPPNEKSPRRARCARRVSGATPKPELAIELECPLWTHSNHGCSSRFLISTLADCALYRFGTTQGGARWTEAVSALRMPDSVDDVCASRQRRSSTKQRARSSVG